MTDHRHNKIITKDGNIFRISAYFDKTKSDATTGDPKPGRAPRGSGLRFEGADEDIMRSFSDNYNPPVTFLQTVAVALGLRR